ncbi:MAG: hypothetical protein JXA33_20625 [Anaerolineae bacterium]|nr:hypothetical protein [Anaerolineae bacterium]
MTWFPLLLADPSPCLRWLVLRQLFHKPEDDPEVQELAALRASDPLIAPLLTGQGPDGAWVRGDWVWHGDRQRMTLLALMRLGFLGFGPEHPGVQRGAEYLFSLQQSDGGWGLPSTVDGLTNRDDEGYTMVPLQTALPLRALAMCGYATDPRAERAYEWLLAQRLEDGAWPTGIAGGGTYGYVAGYRKMPHSRWGCRSNTTGVLLCLAYHPERRYSEAARRALDLLLGRETKEAYTLGYEVTRLIGAEPTRGFMTFYAKFDLALVLDMCWRIGATLEDARVADSVAFIRAQRGEYGLWDAPQPQASRWLTFDLLRSLEKLDTAGDWVSAEPRTPFQTYPKKPQRF